MQLLAVKIIRYILGGLLSFAALNAFAGGYYGMAGAEGVPEEWLEGSIFSNYFIPGLILFVVVGGTFLYAAIAVLAHRKNAKRAVIFSVAVVFTWLTVQVLMIGYVSWMQPVTAAVTTVILFLSFLLPGKQTI